MKGVPFPCDKCGRCCESLAGNPLYRDLDDGTGTCRYFDRATRLCTIYEQRPQKCNIAAAYEWFADKMTYEEFVRQNLAVCQQLKMTHA